MKTSEHACLTHDQKRNACAVLLIGCDREAAASYVGCTMADFQRQMERDTEFAAEVLHAEATCELKHMRNVQTAAGEEKNWRASVWWLERHSSHRGGSTPTVKELKSFLSMLVTIIVEEVRDANDLRRILARFEEASHSLRDMEAQSSDVGVSLSLPAPSAGVAPAATENPTATTDLDGEAV